MRSQAELENQRAIDLLMGVEKHLRTTARLETAKERATICKNLNELLAEREKLWAKPQLEKMWEGP